MDKCEKSFKLTKAKKNVSQMGGLMKWLKNKDGTMRLRRRESAPHQFFTKRQSAKPTSDEAYRESIIRFTKFREHERIQRLSMGANEMAAYHSISGDMPNFSAISTTPTDQNRNGSYQPSTCPAKSYRKKVIPEDHNDTMPTHNGHRTKKFCVKFHMADSTDESDFNFENRRNTRHSMPATTSNAYGRAIQRTQNAIDTSAILEEAIDDFEDAHCTYRGSVNDEESQSNYRSPPTKFYKQNSNPYPSEMSSLSTLCDATQVPEKPKRLLLNSKKSRKLLTEAHFTHAYNEFNNFEIQSPYYTDCSSMISIAEKKNNFPSIDSDNYVTAGHPSTRYDSFVNKHGDTIEYATPCAEIPQYQKRQDLPNCLTSDDSILAGEVFQEDPNECVRMFEENFERTSNASISMHEQSHETRQRKGHVKITDLDKSTDSANTMDDTDIISRTEHIDHLNASQMIPPNRVQTFHETLQFADIICLISEFDSMGRMESKTEMPLHFELGMFRNTLVTARKYPDDDDENEDKILVAETAIIRDAEVLRKIRHPNIINLMALAFDSYKKMALIMEPAKYTLNYQLFVDKNGQLELVEVVTIVKRVARAVAYLQECGICHSNISSLAILIGDKVTDVKLSSFELAVPYSSDIQDEVKLMSMQQPNRVSSIHSKRSPSSKLEVERYQQSTNIESTESFVEISAKYLPYFTDYRRKLTVFNYQAPELLSLRQRFVFPTKQSDTYALTLLLWEMLNESIPFGTYDEATLVDLLEKSYPLKYLQIVEEERCQRFHDILEQGLKRKPETRIDLEKMIRKLEAIETEIYRENEKNQSLIKCCCLKPTKSVKNSRQRSMQQKTIKYDETPNKSNGKPFSAINALTSPVYALSTKSVENNLSPLNYSHFNVDKNLMNEKNSSTLKKRKKVSPTKNTTKRNVRELFGDKMVTTSANDDLDAVALTPQNSEPLSSGRPSNEFNQAILQSAIAKDLELSHLEESSLQEKSVTPSKNKIQQPFGPKEVSNHNDIESKPLNTSNGSFQFNIESYELPKCARNNQIRRCTWLSSDQVNNPSVDYEPLAMASISNFRTQADDTVMPTLNESNDSNRKMNVSIKIVHTQLTPNQSMAHNDSLKSICSAASGMSASSSEDSFSVKSRIKFFRSLESQPVQRRTPNKNKLSISRRSEMSFNEARKAIERAQRHTYPSSNQPIRDVDQNQLLKEITDIKADINNCLLQNRCLAEKSSVQSNNVHENSQLLDSLLQADLEEADESVVQMLDDLLSKGNESQTEETEKRNSVRETVQKLESSLRNEMNANNTCQTIKNKLLNDKIFNPDTKKIGEYIRKKNKLDEVTNEKIEDVIRFVVPSEVENEAGAQLPVAGTSTELPVIEFKEPSTDAENQQSQTLIKRTFYQESIVSGTNVEVPELQSLLVNSPNMSATYASTKSRSSFTTRVTLNMRKCRRRSSDVGLIAPKQSGYDFNTDAINSPHLAEVRHSICGNPLPVLGRANSAIEASSGRMIDQIASEKYANHASTLMLPNDQLQSSLCSSVLTGIFNGKQIQSIEDLYIDDDFGGISLAANMKLMTNSVDSLDNINFDITATHIFEQNSESMLTTNLNAIEDAREHDRDEATAEQS
ncbi:uncharacterized protein LOC116339430 [Contarinia nasturtii]|uniref:uncharacterized protein LOC116339430 n=1 Tax=Contarinia nasturtii TaxID=265458 RepID=UPI0012D3F4F9|nr:uncharacterized protein LOC116339430 [Contarinia nasturtii]